VADDRESAGDPIPQSCEVIEVHVGELMELFNAIDPSPFGERDLDPKADEFIVEWARDAHRSKPLGLLVHLDRPAGLSEEAAVLRDSIHKHFSRRAESARSRLRQLFRVGRTSLAIGTLFLVTTVLLGEWVEAALGERRLGAILRESLLIGGWVAMWRPLEIFLYGWWPILAEVRLYDRLSAMPVHIRYTRGANPDAWRHDWPAAESQPQRG
jgi:hypothetical protein